MHFAPAPLRTVAALCMAFVATLHQPATAAGSAGQALAGAAFDSLTAAQRFALQRPGPATLASPAALAPTAVDANPPQLTAIHADRYVDATADIPQLLINLGATDDAAGVYYLYFEATGPNGQKKYGSLGPQFPVATLAGTTALRFGRNDAPGVWTITDLEVGDAAGNWRDYTAAQLAALGNTRFWVQNSYAKYLDNTPPALASATILTPSLSLSGGAATLAGVKVNATDAGNPAATGVQQVELVFCTLVGGNCFSMFENDAVEGRTSTTLTPIAAVAGYPAGDYYVYYVHLTDWGGNQNYIVGTDFGGPADFSRLMAGGHKITLLP